MIRSLQRLLIASRNSSFQNAFWVLVDQGIVSAGTFLMGLVVARGLEQESYGLYALILSLVFSFGTLHSSFIGYPLMVRGSSMTEDEYRPFASTSLLITSVMSLVMAFVIASWLATTGSEPLIVFAGGFALWGWHLQQMSRSALIARRMYAVAVPGDFVSYVGRVFLLGGVVLSGGESLGVVLFVIGLTSLVGAALQSWRLRLRWVSLESVRSRLFTYVSLGSWPFLSSALSALTLQGFIWTLALGFGNSAVAEYQAAMNVMGLTHPLLFAITSVVVPATSMAYAQGDASKARRVAWKQASPLAFVFFAILLVLVVFREQILALLYGDDSPYAGLTKPLLWLVVAYVAQFGVTVLRSYMNAIERARLAFYSQIVMTLSFLVIGIPLVLYGQVEGATAGFAVVFIGGWIALSYLSSKPSPEGSNTTTCSRRVEAGDES